MNFRRHQPDDDTEINLVPLIDVLLVILIFLAATTTFNRYSQLDVTLPQAHSEAAATDGLSITISRDGMYALNGRLLGANTRDDIIEALRAAATGQAAPVLIVDADAQAAHAAVVRVMEAARMAGIEKIAFATQSAR